MLQEDYMFILETMGDFIDRAQQSDLRLKDDCDRFRAVISKPSFIMAFGNGPEQLAFLGLLMNQIFLRRQDLILSDLTVITNTLLTALGSDIHSLYLDEAGEGIKVKVSQQP